MSTVVLLIDTATPVIYTLSLHDALPISLPLIEPGDRAVETVLPLENDGRILNRSGFLVRLVCLPANLARRIVRPLTGLWPFLTHEEELGFSKLEVWVQCHGQRCDLLEDFGFLPGPLPRNRNWQQSQK